MIPNSIANHHRLVLSQRARLSISKHGQLGQASPRKAESGALPQQNPSYPAFTFQSLGAGRKVKFFIIACLAVVGTIESVFWVNVLWAKFSPSSTETRSKPEGN
jgi:hypothetical protein